MKQSDDCIHYAELIGGLHPNRLTIVWINLTALQWKNTTLRLSILCQMIFSLKDAADEFYEQAQPGCDISLTPEVSVDTPLCCIRNKRVVDLRFASGRQSHALLLHNSPLLSHRYLLFTQTVFLYVLYRSVILYPVCLFLLRRPLRRYFRWNTVFQLLCVRHAACAHVWQPDDRLQFWLRVRPGGHRSPDSQRVCQVLDNAEKQVQIQQHWFRVASRLCRDDIPTEHSPHVCRSVGHCKSTNSVPKTAAGWRLHIFVYKTSLIWANHNSICTRGKQASYTSSFCPVTGKRRSSWASSTCQWHPNTIHRNCGQRDSHPHRRDNCPLDDHSFVTGQGHLACGISFKD